MEVNRVQKRKLKKKTALEEQYWALNTWMFFIDSHAAKQQQQQG